MKTYLGWRAVLVLSFLILTCLACVDEGDDANGCGGDDNRSNDDHSGDDDATVDDDTQEDDTADDDTAGDDDSVDDDSVDDDTIDDDSVDDDITPDDDTTPADDDTGAAIELIDGGRPGVFGTSIARAPGGELYIAAVKGRQLRVYSPAKGESIIVPGVAFAAEPELAIDSGGYFHLAYRNVVSGELTYTTNVSGAWKTDALGAVLQENRYLSIVVDANGAVHLAYLDYTDWPVSGTVAAKYATNASGPWVAETIDQASSYTYNISLALDGDGRPRVSYYRGYALYYAHRNALTWRRVEVDDGQNAGRFSSIVIANDGILHIAYLEASSRELRYATSAGGLWWNKEVIDADGGSHLSLAADGAGHLSVAYYSDANKKLKFAGNAGGAWSVEDVDTDGNVGNQCSLVLDQAGEPHISYYDISHGALKYAVKSARGWNAKVVDAGGYPVQSRVAVDADGQVHIAYGDHAEGTVRYANNVAGSWAVQTVDVIGSEHPYPYPHLAIDSAGYAHLAYVRQSEGQVIYAKNATGPWEYTIIDAAAGPGTAAAGGIALDDDGAVHLLYVLTVSHSPAPPTTIIHYATNSGGPWISETVDTWDQITAEDLGFALDQNGQPRLAYYRPDGVIYASRDAGEWSLETVDDFGFDGISLAVDADGHAHLAYAQYIELSYAANASGSWVIEPLSPPYSPQHPSIAVSGDGRVNLVYYDLSNGDLRYAAKAGGVWTDVTIDTAGQVGDSSSLALDGGGYVHAVYLGEYALWHAVFPEGYGN